MVALQKDKILRNEVTQFAEFLTAFKECSPEVQEVVTAMASIIADEDSDPEEVLMAKDTFIEALWPGTATDLLKSDVEMRNQPEFAAEREKLDVEEQAFAERVKRLMESRSMTQEHLAEATGVTFSAIANILEANSRPQQSTIAKFAAALDVSSEELWPELK